MFEKFTFIIELYFQNIVPVFGILTKFIKFIISFFGQENAISNLKRIPWIFIVRCVMGYSRSQTRYEGLKTAIFTKSCLDLKRRS